MGKPHAATLHGVDLVRAGARPTDAAQQAGVSYMTLYCALRRYGVGWETVRVEISPNQGARSREQALRRQAEAREENRKRKLACELVRRAGRPLLRRVVDRALCLLNEGLDRERVIAQLQEGARV